MANYETLDYEERDHVAWVTLNRPEAHNAFTALMQEECQNLWRSLRTNDRVRVIVLTGAGEHAFCVGIDRDVATLDLDRPELRSPGRLADCPGPLQRHRFDPETTSKRSLDRLTPAEVFLALVKSPQTICFCQHIDQTGPHHRGIRIEQIFARRFHT